MNKDVQKDATCGFFQFEGELRTDHIEALYNLVGGSQLGSRNILVDCRRVSHFDEGVLDALVDFERAISEAGGKVMLVGLRHPVMHHVVLMEPLDVKSKVQLGETA